MEILRIKGNKDAVSKFDEIHTRKIINLLIAEFNNAETYDVDIMELIAGFTFALTGDSDSLLSKEGRLEDDKKKTKNNIDKLNNYLYGGYRSNNDLSNLIENLDPKKCYYKDGTEQVYKEMYNKINELVNAVNKIREQ